MEDLFMAIVSPDKMDFTGKNIIMIISGLPGVGKTTVALSAPDVLLADFDEGLARVNPAHRKDAIICKKYGEFLEDVQAAKSQYKTIVVDTGGAMIESMKEWAAEVHCSEVMTSKGNIDNRKVFGVVKGEFIRVSRELRQNFNVIYLFHESKDKENDGIFYSLICEGSAREIVWQPADLGAHMFIQGGERYLGFTPTAEYSAKAAYGIKGLVKIPELKDGDPNDFLLKLFAQVKTNLAAESEALKPQQEAYEKAIEAGTKLIGEIDSPEKAMPTLTAVRELEHALTSQKELEAAFKAKMKELGYTYSREQKAYVAAAE